MTIKTYTLTEKGREFGTRNILKTMRSIHRDVVESNRVRYSINDLEWDERRDRYTETFYGEIIGRYTFGIHTGLRSTFSMSFTPSTGEFVVSFPQGYAGWSKANGYTRTLVSLHDEFAFAFIGMGFVKLVEEEVY